ncbi:MAG: hypothetical protein JW888_04395 [Pirellulales bacterium]|nr:hypothetical protein [Pirellulales bacterium]
MSRGVQLFCTALALVSTILLMCSAGHADLVHRYGFTSDASDSVGTADGTPYSQGMLGPQTEFIGGQAVLGNDGETYRSNDQGISPPAEPPGAYIDLPNGTISALGNQATFETWFTWNGGGTYQRIFDFGTSDIGEDSSTGGPNNRQIMLVPYGNYSRLGLWVHDSDDTYKAVFADALLLDNAEHHIAVTWDGANDQATVYCDGASVGCISGLTFSLADLIDDNNWLGRSQWNDLMLAGSYNEFRIYNEALSSAQVYKNCQDGPDGPIIPPPPVTPTQPAAPIHQYSFTSDCSDSIGSADGLLVNNTGNAVYSGGKLVLGNDGTQRSGDLTGNTSGDYVDLPNGLISGLTDNATFEFWVTSDCAPGTIWERIFDFGTSQGGEGISDSGADCSSILGVARSAENIFRFGHRYGDTNETSYVSAPAALEAGVETHIACVWDGDNDQMTLYVNGEFMTTNDTLFDLADLVDLNNWLGRAQYNDLMFEGSFNEFRIYDYALTAGEVLYSFQNGLEPENIPGDADGDGHVDQTDAIRLAENWGATSLIAPYTSMWQMGDFDDDGIVGPKDASILGAHWDATGAGASAVPEPSTLLMALCGLIALVGCRRVR